MSIGSSARPGFIGWFSKQGIARTTIEKLEVQVRLYSIFYDQMIIEWKIPSSWGSCSFNIYRADTQDGVFEKINSTPLFSNFFRDTSTPDVSKFRSSYYKVEVTLPIKRAVSSVAVTYQNERSSWVEIRAREINRRELFLLRKFVGIPSLLFRRKTFGKRCTNCWDENVEKVVKDRCPVCLGTSFEGGYFEGIDILAQYEPTPNQSQLTAGGVYEPNTIPAWTIAYPEMHVFDMVLRIPDWRMYRVEALQTTELQTVPVRQLLTLNEIDKESVEFRLALQAVPDHLKPRVPLNLERDHGAPGYQSGYIRE